MTPPEPRFTPIFEHRPGLLFDLLSQSYQELLLADPVHWAGERAGWRQFDQEAFSNPDTVGRCVFVSTVGGLPVGLGSYDPRQAPELGIVGHNCVLPEYRGRGIGKQQIREILRRFRALGIRRAVVSTGEHPFFQPVQRMYLACGFVETKRFAGGPDPRYRVIEYEREL